jgi:hypothetical protein
LPTPVPTQRRIFDGADGDSDDGGETFITESPSLSPSTAMPSLSPSTSNPTSSPTLGEPELEQVEYEFLWGTSDGEVFGHTLDLSDDGTVLTVGAFLYSETVQDGGRILRFDLTSNGDFVQVQGDEFSYYGFQKSGSGSGNRLLALDSYTGLVEVYEFVDSELRNTGSINSGYFPLGIAVTMSRDGRCVALVGEDAETSGQESTRIWVNMYEYSEQTGEYTQLGESILFSTSDSEDYGQYDIAVDDACRYVIASQIGVDDTPGKIQTYRREGVQLTPIGQDFTSDTPNDGFGRDVEIVVTAQAQLLIAFSAPNSDIVYMYSLNTVGEWDLMGEPITPDFAPDQTIEFGYDIEFNQAGDIMFIGAPSFEDREGAVVQLRLDDDGEWIESNFILSGPSGSFFGQTLACSRDCSILAVGAPTDCLNEDVCGGGVYIFRDNRGS